MSDRLGAHPWVPTWGRLTGLQICTQELCSELVRPEEKQMYEGGSLKWPR